MIAFINLISGRQFNLKKLPIGIALYKIENDQVEKMKAENNLPKEFFATSKMVTKPAYSYNRYNSAIPHGSCVVFCFIA